MSQYIGKTISLISSKGIRYVGILEDVNGEEATVTLKSVKPFGTEGRLGDPAREVPPSNDVYPVVVFRGSDVHDLSVLEDAPTAAPVTAAPAQQPQPQGHQQSPPQQSPPQQSQYQQQNRVASGEQEHEDQEDSYRQYQQQRQQRQQRQQQQRPRNYNKYNTEETFETTVPKSDFDFESISTLNREDLKTQASDNGDDDETKKEDIAPAYDKKKSFFDTISSSATQTRPARQFNLYNSSGSGNDRNNGRGRGRSGRGRGRGRGRGNRDDLPDYGNNKAPEWS